MEKDTLVKVAMSCIFTVNAARTEVQETPDEIVPPRPIEEICEATVEAEDGIGLDQDIIEFLRKLEEKGLVLDCDSAFEYKNLEQQ